MTKTSKEEIIKAIHCDKMLPIKYQHSVFCLSVDFCFFTATWQLNSLDFEDELPGWEFP